MKRGYDIITVGSGTVDVFIKTDSELIKIINPKREEEDLIAYPVGAKILIKQLDFMTGGGGTNTAVAFARMGLKTGYIGNLGNDDNKDMILKELKKERVDFIGTIGKEQTGYSIILDSIEHDRTILAFKGANDMLDFKKLKLGSIKTKWFYMCTMMNQSFRSQVELARFAEKRKIKMAFNPSEYLVKMGVDALKDILSRIDVIIFNTKEAHLLFGFDPYRDKKDVKLLLKETRSTGPGIVVITDGRNGAYAYDGEFCYYAKPNNVKIVETTGAGDAFSSGFVTGLAKGKSIEFCMKLGQTNAESVIQNYGAKNVLLSYRKAVEVIRKRPCRVVKKKM